MVILTAKLDAGSGPSAHAERSTVAMHRRRSCGRRMRAGVAIGMLLSLAGCLGPRQYHPDTDPAKLSDDAFMSYLATVPVVTVDEAFRAMLILADGKDSCKAFEERRAALVSRGIAREAWNLEPDNVIDRGSVAAMTCKILQMRGGVNRAVFGGMGLGDRRYANRELIYRNLLADGPDYAGMQGPVLVAMFARCDEYMEQHKLYEAKPVELGTEQDAVGASQGK